MKVLFDTSALYVTRAGVYNYVQELRAALKKSDQVQIEEAAYLPSYSRDTKWRTIDSFKRDLTWPFKLSRKARKVDADIIHAPAFVFPLYSKTQTLVTIHDVYSLVKPGDFPKWHQLINQNYIRASIMRRKQVLVLSEFTKNELLRFFPSADPDLIHVVHSAIPESRQLNHDAELANSIRKTYHLDSPYILSVSTIEPRKNFIKLIQSFASIAHKIPHQLVLVGQSGWNNLAVYDLIQELKLQDRVCFTGYVSDEVLNGLYTNAAMFVFPSLYEGFGFTPLEAMKCGCPVLSSNTSCMPEVLGSAAAYFNPHEVQDMALALYETLNDLEKLEELRSRGLEHASKFSWANTAAKTVDLYRKIV